MQDFTDESLTAVVDTTPNLILRDKQLSTGKYYIENSDKHYAKNAVTFLDDTIKVIHLGEGYWMYHEIWKKLPLKKISITSRVGNNLKDLKTIKSKKKLLKINNEVLNVVNFETANSQLVKAR